MFLFPPSFFLIVLFQNISCLRFIRISAMKKENEELFQNISCLRFIDIKNEITEEVNKFQNISCLRFIS